MANPQLEEGYTKIANEIMEALAKIRISGEEWQILNVILRKTYGYNKKEDWISLSQFCLATGLTKSSICRAIHKLLIKNTIDKKDNGSAPLYSFNKDFDTWKPLTKKIMLTKLIKGIDKKDNLPLTKKRHTKDNITKDNITKESETKKQEKDKEVFKEGKDTNNNLICMRVIKLWGDMVLVLGRGKAVKSLRGAEKQNLLELIRVGYTITDIERAFTEYTRLIIENPDRLENKYFNKYYDLARFIDKGIVKWSNPDEVIKIEEQE